MKLEILPGPKYIAYFLLLSVSPLLGEEGEPKHFLSPGTEPFLGGSGFTVMQGSTQI
jgi:hypothetical protein